MHWSNIPTVHQTPAVWTLTADSPTDAVLKVCMDLSSL